MKIDELGFYLQANGGITEVTRITAYLNANTENVETIDYKDYYYSDGRYYLDEDSDKDLIAHIPPALHFELIRVIEVYHQGGSFKSVIDNCYKNHLEKKEK